MGFFSYKTADTQESIANCKSPRFKVQTPVYFLLPNGAEPIKELAYGGFGEFGSLDAYAWLAKMNLPDETRHLDLHEDVAELRVMGLDLEAAPGKIKYPVKLSFNPDAQYEQLNASEYCDNQGYFY